MSQSLSFPMSATKMCRDLQKLDAILHADTTTTEVTFWGERRVIWRSSEDKFEKYVSLKALTEKINSIGRLRADNLSFSEMVAGCRIARKMWSLYDNTDKQRNQSNLFTRILVFIRDNTFWLFIPNLFSARSQISPVDFYTYSDKSAYRAAFNIPTNQRIEDHEGFYPDIRKEVDERDKSVFVKPEFIEKMAAQEQSESVS
ncbi:MAG: hypothetical protein Q8L98_00095 [Chlamydiales bacterium]|nr:hypothetical protein [Chlamydiales bacterium]